MNPNNNQTENFDLDNSKDNDIINFITEYSPLGIISFDSNGVVTDCNQSFCRIMNSTNEKLIGLNMLTELRNDLAKQTIAKALETGEAHFFSEYTTVTSDQTIFLKADFKTITSDNGDFIKGIGIFNDINEINKINYHHQFERVISSIYSRITNIEYDKIDNEILKALEDTGNFLKMDFSIIFELENNILTPQYKWLTGNNKNSQKDPIDIKFYHWLKEKINKRNIFHIKSSETMPPESNIEREFLISKKIKSIIIIPITIGENIFGILCYGSKKQNSEITENIILLLEIVIKVFQSLLERKKTEYNVKIFNQILSSSNDNMLYINNNETIRAANRAFLNSKGKSTNEVIGNKFDSFFSKATYKVLKKFFNLCVEGETINSQIYYDICHGESFIYELSMYPFHNNDNKIDGVIIYSKDVTKRIQVEVDLFMSRETERREIGFELHDGLSQQLLGIAIKTKILSDILKEKSIEDSNLANEIVEMINSSMAETKKIASGLFPISLEGSDFFILFRNIKNKLNDERNIECTIEYNESEKIIHNKISIHVFYIIQETVTNIIKHSNADKVTISLYKNRNRNIFTIKDNGIGINKSHTSSGMGLSIMQFRAQMIGASLDITSKKDEGTVIKCTFI